MATASQTGTAESRAEPQVRAGAESAWGNVVLGALLMLATLPGRTQGLGLITEPLLREFGLDRVTYADINLWATLAGSVFCLPAGWLIDHRGLRRTTLGILALLSVNVWFMSTMVGSVSLLFVLVLLSRGLGQSALSVASITAVGKSFAKGGGWAMGIYSVLSNVSFAIAFLVVGRALEMHGWRTSWAALALGLIITTVLAALFLREPLRSVSSMETASTGVTLGEALRMPVFWVFSGGTTLFSLVFSGFGLFNQAILAERGFDEKTYHHFLAMSSVFALCGQMLCGWLSRSQPMTRLLALALFLFASGLAALPLLHTPPQLWMFTVIFGVAAGFIMVIFFAIWGQAFGRAHLGRIQGAAQMIAVLATAVGPLFFAESQKMTGSYTPLLITLAVVTFCAGFAAWRTKLVPFHQSPTPHP